MLEKHLCLVFRLLSKVNSVFKARKKYNTNFVKSVNVKYLGIYKES